MMVTFEPIPIVIRYQLGLSEMEKYYEFIEGHLNRVIEDNENSIKEINNEVSERLINMGYDEEYLASEHEGCLAHLVDMSNQDVTLKIPSSDRLIILMILKFSRITFYQDKAGIL
jgi:hypothetical protein